MLVAITGKKGSGKDTAADYLCNHYGFEKYSLADPIKKAIQHLFQLDKDQLWGDRKDEMDSSYGLTPRKIMQVFGGEFIDDMLYDLIPELEKKVPRGMLKVFLFKKWNFMKTYFDSVLSDALDFNSDYRNHLYNVVISDMRYVIESEAINDMGGIIWKVVRPDLEGDDDHASESEVDDIKADELLMNDGSIQELHQLIDEIMNE